MKTIFLVVSACMLAVAAVFPAHADHADVVEKLKNMPEIEQARAHMERMRLRGIMGERLRKMGFKNVADGLYELPIPSAYPSPSLALTFEFTLGQRASLWLRSEYSQSSVFRKDILLFETLQDALQHWKDVEKGVRYVSEANGAAAARP